MSAEPTDVRAQEPTSRKRRAVLVTGVAGFIGMHVVLALLKRGHEVVGLDRIEGPGPVELRRRRLEHIESIAAGSPRYRFVRADIADPGLRETLADFDFDRIVHLAAQAGVRYSIENPEVYTQSNLVGTARMLEIARHRKSTHFVFASSSSVYGGRTNTPFHEDDRIDRPVSYYAATKAANESMAASYSALYGLPATGLRFFTVYGPWGRPDMAPWLFTDAILQHRPIRVFAGGTLQRDFTYVDDIVEGICRVLDAPPAEDASTRGAGATPFRLYNIGNHRPDTVNTLIATIESALGQSAIRDEQPMQAGDVPITCADITRLQRDMGFRPQTPLAEGIARFCTWFREHHGR